MMRFIFLLTLMCSSLNAWAETETNIMCREILKNEKKDMIIGGYYDKDGFVSINSDPTDPYVSSINGNCKGFAHNPYVTVYDYAKDPSQYLIFSYTDTMSSGNVRPWIYLLDKQTCKKTRTMSSRYTFSSDKSVKFSYAVYKDVPYGIFRGQDKIYDEKKQKWILEKTYAPVIVELDPEHDLESYNCN